MARERRLKQARRDKRATLRVVSFADRFTEGEMHEIPSPGSTKSAFLGPEESHLSAFLGSFRTSFLACIFLGAGRR